MKKLVLAAVLTLASAGAVADNVALVSVDDSPFTRMCLAATESWAALEQVIVEEAMTDLRLEEVECNGKPLIQFAREYERRPHVEIRQLTMVRTVTSVEKDFP